MYHNTIAKKTNKIIATSNLDNATPEEKERFMKVLIEAQRLLYRSVVERKIVELLKKL